MGVVHAGTLTAADPRNTGATPLLAKTMNQPIATEVPIITQWLGPDEAAAALGISLRTLQYRAKRGEIERRRQGRKSYYRLETPVAPYPAVTNWFDASPAPAAPNAFTAPPMASFSPVIDGAPAPSLRRSEAPTPVVAPQVVRSNAEQRAAGPTASVSSARPGARGTPVAPVASVASVASVAPVASVASVAPIDAPAPPARPRMEILSPRQVADRERIEETGNLVASVAPIGRRSAETPLDQPAVGEGLMLAQLQQLVEESGMFVAPPEPDESLAQRQTGARRGRAALSTLSRELRRPGVLSQIFLIALVLTPVSSVAFGLALWWSGLLATIVATAGSLAWTRIVRLLEI